MRLFVANAFALFDLTGRVAMKKAEVVDQHAKGFVQVNGAITVSS